MGGSKQKILLIIGVILLLIVVGYVLVAGTTRNKSSQNRESMTTATNNATGSGSGTKNTCTTDFGMVEAPRASADGAFTAALTNTQSLAVISPGKFVGDSRFTYLWIKNKQRVPIFAPADGVLVQIFYKTRSDLSSDMSQADYDLVFLVDCHTIYRINHITDPVDELASQKPIDSPMQLKPGSGFNNNDIRPKNNIVVKAGQQIGTTTGTPAAHNFDFGIFVDKEAICPYEKFVEPIRSDFLALLGNTSRPIPGTVCDVSGMN